MASCSQRCWSTITCFSRSAFDLITTDLITTDLITDWQRPNTLADAATIRQLLAITDPFGHEFHESIETGRELTVNSIIVREHPLVV